MLCEKITLKNTFKKIMIFSPKFIENLKKLVVFLFVYDYIDIVVVGGIKKGRPAGWWADELTSWWTHLLIAVK